MKIHPIAFLSHSLPCNNSVNHDRCVANISPNFYLENLFPELQQPCYTQYFQNLFFQFLWNATRFLHIYPLAFPFWVSQTLILFPAYPLVFHYAGPTSYLRLLLAMCPKLDFCSAPGVSSSQLICRRRLKFAPHLTTAVKCEVGFRLLRVEE